MDTTEEEMTTGCNEFDAMVALSLACDEFETIISEDTSETEKTAAVCGQASCKDYMIANAEDFGLSEEEINTRCSSSDSSDSEDVEAGSAQFGVSLFMLFATTILSFAMLH